MGELITIKKTDPVFEKYLMGTFSDQKVALPVQSLNVNSQQEEVTFRILDSSEIKSPTMLSKWVQILKLRNLILVLLPLLLVATKNWLDETMGDTIVGMISAIAAILLHLSINLRNDFIDHCSGLDRVHPQAGSRAIQNGWVRAFQVKKWSRNLMFLGVLLGFPALIIYQEVLYVIAISLGVGAFGVYFFKSGLKLRRWSEVFSFLLLGPLLTSGFQGAMGASIDLEALAIGVLTGWFAVYYIHVKNFEMLMVNSKAKFENTVSILGFEKSKKLIYFWWVSWLFMVGLYHWFYCSHWWTYLFILLSLLLLPPLYFALKSVDSPLGSSMLKAVRTAQYLYVFVISFWVLESYWYLAFF
jgi:1,4-dihydroxy-2-naphthoate octaprenyltransferase